MAITHLLKKTNIRMALVPAAHVACAATYSQSWLLLQKLYNSWTAATTLNHILADTKPPQASKQWWLKESQEVTRQLTAVSEIKHSQGTFTGVTAHRT